MEQLGPNEKRCNKCKVIKNKTEFYNKPTHKDGLDYTCKTCRCNYKVVKNKSGFECPFCHYLFRSLASHAARKHGKTKTDLMSAGVNEFIIPAASENYSRASSGPRPNAQLGYVVTLANRRISFPEDAWPADCKYAKIKIIKRVIKFEDGPESRYYIQFNPLNKKTRDAKAVLKDSRGVRYRVYVHIGLLKSLKLTLPYIKLRDRAGFEVVLYESDLPLVEAFKYWAKHGLSMRNISGLTIFASGARCITIADHLWPTNAKFARLEYNEAARGNPYKYLDIYPHPSTHQYQTNPTTPHQPINTKLTHEPTHQHITNPLTHSLTITYLTLSTTNQPPTQQTNSNKQKKSKGQDKQQQPPASQKPGKRKAPLKTSRAKPGPI
jgi:hypothetical protein